MYKALKNVRLNNVTYEKGSTVESIPDPKYSHCFEKIGKREKEIHGEKVETTSVNPGEKRKRKK